ncbi:MAG TPA: GNAT family N-acetyltransferase [Vicinamibacterales bacterium]|nr:GNAT family N-acetyltransferase [Vicinamibacterales bacterium]
MSSVEFMTMTDRRFQADVLRMMGELYEHDDLRVDPASFPKTIDYVLANPSRGRIVLAVANDTVHAYALLVPYWSNEWGGIVALLDELLVDREFRRRGIAKALLRFLERERPFDAVVVVLEVSSQNTQARALYESMGFTDRHLRMMTRRLTPTT